jgi:transcription initiation factor TFIID subunit 1
MKNLFVIGQTYPVTEVPGPHSRKITNTIKHRLQTIAFKLLAKTKEERLKISRLMKYFPDQNELQMRQRLKVQISPISITPALISNAIRSSWSTIEGVLIKDFGGSNPTGPSHHKRRC